MILTTGKMLVNFDDVVPPEFIKQMFAKFPTPQPYWAANNEYSPRIYIGNCYLHRMPFSESDIEIVTFCINGIIDDPIVLPDDYPHIEWASRGKKLFTKNLQTIFTTKTNKNLTNETLTTVLRYMMMVYGDP